MFTITLFHDKIMIRKRGGIYESESFILPDFYTVAQTGNISRAAKELYISQPAISKSIQKLEESVGCKLFPEAQEA